MRRVFVDPGAPQRDAIEEAATWILAGAVVAIPTDTLYGLAVDPFNADAVARLFAIKGRDAARALPLVAADRRQVESTMGRLTGDAARLAERFWPGPLTLVIPAPASLAAAVIGSGRTVGVRVPNHDVLRAVLAICGKPVTATSANLSGQAPTEDPDRVERELGRRVDFLLDTGATPGGAPSTIVDVTRTPPTLVRAGAIPWDDIEACLHTV